MHVNFKAYLRTQMFLSLLTIVLLLLLNTVHKNLLFFYLKMHFNLFT